MKDRLADAIRKVIRDSGVSIHALGALSAVDKGILSRFLRGERTMTVETAGRVLNALGCTIAISCSEPAAPQRTAKRPPKERPGK
jgi:hypothetical protein